MLRPHLANPQRQGGGGIRRDLRDDLLVGPRQALRNAADRLTFFRARRRIDPLLAHTRITLRTLCRHLACRDIDCRPLFRISRHFSFAAARIAACTLLSLRGRPRLLPLWPGGKRPVSSRATSSVILTSSQLRLARPRCCLCRRGENFRPPPRRFRGGGQWSGCERGSLSSSKSMPSARVALSPTSAASAG